MAKKVYIGVNDIAREVKKMYIGVNGVAKKVKKAYIGDKNGKARLVYSNGVSRSISYWDNSTWYEIDPTYFSGAPTSAEVGEMVNLSQWFDNANHPETIAFISPSNEPGNEWLSGEAGLQFEMPDFDIIVFVSGYEAERYPHSIYYNNHSIYFDFSNKPNEAYAGEEVTITWEAPNGDYPNPPAWNVESIDGGYDNWYEDDDHNLILTMPDSDITVTLLDG